MKDMVLTYQPRAMFCSMKIVWVNGRGQIVLSLLFLNGLLWEGVTNSSMHAW